MRPETPEDERHQLGVAPRPEVLDVEVGDRPVHEGEFQLDARAVLVLALVHHEDPVGPEEQVLGETHRGEIRDTRGADLVALIRSVEVLGGATAVDVGGADEEDALAGSGIDGHHRPL